MTISGSSKLNLFCCFGKLLMWKPGWFSFFQSQTRLCIILFILFCSCPADLRLLLVESPSVRHEKFRERFLACEVKSTTAQFCKLLQVTLGWWYLTPNIAWQYVQDAGMTCLSCHYALVMVAWCSLTTVMVSWIISVGILRIMGKTHPSHFPKERGWQRQGSMIHETHVTVAVVMACL